MFHRKVSHYIKEKRLIAGGDGVLVALSGGADSVALLRVLLRLGVRCEAAHCNFCLRGEESDRDERFVRSLCAEQGVELHVARFDTKAYAAARHVSIEMAARELRYGWFGRLREERGLEAIAVAHHRDDSVETLLLNLVRGTGVNGLKGIPPRNGRVVRPLLAVSRRDILDYLASLRQEYVTDSTNLRDDVLRNKIRLDVLPLLRELNPSVSESLADTSARLADAARIYDRAMEEGRRRVVAADGEGMRVSVSRLLEEEAPAALLFEILHPLGFNSARTGDVWRSLSGQPGRRFASAGWEVLRDRTELLIRPRPSAPLNPPQGGTGSANAPGSPPSPRKGEAILAPPLGELRGPGIEGEVTEVPPGFVVPRDRAVACLDADKLEFPLTLRKWRQGDRFVPFGMRGSKLVSDYLTDRKRTLFQKESQYVVCSGESIVWLVGERPDDRFRVTERTRRVAVLRMAPPV